MGVYLALNLIVVLIGIEQIATHPQVFANWKTALFAAQGILWFAGASAMAGLLNIVPRYLPRYGMAPEWARAKPPVGADLHGYWLCGDAPFPRGRGRARWRICNGRARSNDFCRGGGNSVGVAGGSSGSRYMLRLDHARIYLHDFGQHYRATRWRKNWGFFIAAIVLSSLVSRVWRTTEPRVEKITLDSEAQRFIDEMDAQGELRIIANQPRRCNDAEYTHREQEQREDNNIPADEPIVFLEIYVRDASEFSADLNIHGVSVDRHRVLRGESAAVANAICPADLHLAKKFRDAR